MNNRGTLVLTEDEFINMLETFQTTDLQELLSSFGVVTFGQHFELKERALSLLKYNPMGLNYHGYLGKITEIYNRNQRQPMVTTGMEQVQLSRPPPPPYPNHLTFFPQIGSSQVMPSFQTGINENNIPQRNNVQYSYLPVFPLNVVSQAPQANLQWYTITPSTVISNSPYNNLNHENPFNPSATHLAGAKLKRLPFYKVIAEIIKPTTLIGHFQCTLRRYPEGMKETAFEFTLSPEHATRIGMNRDVSNRKKYYIYQLQIRICLYKPGCLELVDYLPKGLHIRLNNKICPLPAGTRKSHSANGTRRFSPPINCTELAKFNPSFTNTVIINWIPDVNSYVMSMCLVEKLTPDSLLQKLIEKGPKSSEETKIYIREKLANLDPDLATVSYRVSLVCPLGKIRVQIPAKSTNCNHLQCFDARTFILMNEKKPTWMCPTCNHACPFEDIQIQSYFLDIVSSPNLPDHCKEIELFADGTWKLYEENKKPVEIDVEGKPRDSINSDGGDNGNFIEAKEEHNHNPESQKESGNMKSIIDLTLSEDEEPITKKDKPENEALSADCVLPVSAVSSTD